MKRPRNLILIGGGGHCKSCIDVIESIGYFHIVGILDTKENIGNRVLGYPIIGSDEDIVSFVHGNEFLITMGQIKTSFNRERLYQKVLESGGKFAKIISNRAHVSRTATIKNGTIVMHDAIVNSESHINENVIVNTKALIEHDVEIEAHCHISTAAVINGNVKIGKQSFIGSNSTVVNGVTVPEKYFLKAATLYKG